MPPKRGNLGILAPATAAEIAGAAAGAAERKEKNKNIAGWGGLNEGILVPNNRNNSNNNGNGKAKKKARGANNWGGADILHGMGEEAGIGTGVEEEEGGGAGGGGGGGSSNRGYGRSLSAAAERYAGERYDPRRSSSLASMPGSLPSAAEEGAGVLPHPLLPNITNADHAAVAAALNAVPGHVAAAANAAAAASFAPPVAPGSSTKRKRNNGNAATVKAKGAGGAAAAPLKNGTMRKPKAPGGNIGGAATAGAGGGNNGKAAAAAVAAGAGGGAAAAAAADAMNALSPDELINSIIKAANAAAITKTGSKAHRNLSDKYADLKNYLYKYPQHGIYIKDAIKSIIHNYKGYALTILTAMTI